MTLVVLFAPAAIAACFSALLACIQEIVRDVVFGASGDAAASGTLAPVVGRWGISAMGGPMGAMGEIRKAAWPIAAGKALLQGRPQLYARHGCAYGRRHNEAHRRLAVGDVVQSTDPEAGETGSREVTAVWVPPGLHCRAEDRRQGPANH